MLITHTIRYLLNSVSQELDLRNDPTVASESPSRENLPTSCFLEGCDFLAQTGLTELSLNTWNADDRTDLCRKLRLKAELHPIRLGSGVLCDPTALAVPRLTKRSLVTSLLTCSKAFKSTVKCLYL